MAEAVCDHCGDALGAGGQRWKRTMPTYEVFQFCAVCAGGLAERASERAASEDDELRIRGMTATLAGEVWQSPTTLFWFRDPIVLRPRPVPAPASITAEPGRAPKRPPKAPARPKPKRGAQRKPSRPLKPKQTPKARRKKRRR